MSDNFQQVIQLAFEVLGAADAQRVADVLDRVGAAGGGADTKLGPLIDTFEQLATQGQLVDKALDLKTRLDANEGALTRAKQSLADLNAEFERTDKSSADINLAFAQAQKQVNSLAAEQLKLQSASAATGAQLKAAGIDATQLGTAHADLKNKTTQTAGELVKAAKAAADTAEAHKKAAAGAKEAGTAFEFVKDHLKEIISVAAAVEIALKGIEFAKDSVSNAAALEAQLSRVKATAQDALGQFAGLDEAVEDAAQKANVSAQTSAAALASLVGSGKSAKDAMEALVPTLQLAKIANIDVGQAADLVAKNLDAFNLPASQATKVVDLLTAASHGSAAGLAAISNAAAELAPDAKAIGLDFDRTAGLLGLLADKGFNAGNSVRALRTIFQDLQNPTSTLRGELLALGDGTGNLNNAIAYLTSGTPRANQALLTLSGGARTVVELLGQAGPAALAKFTAGLQQQTGAAQRTAEVLDDNLKGASTRFGLSIDAIGEKLAKPVLEPLKNELTKLAGELNKFAESPDFKKLESQVGEIAANGTKAIDAFLHGIDWKSFLDDAQSSLGAVVDGLKSVAESASTIASVVNKTADVIGTAYHGVAGAVDVVVGANARAVDGFISVEQSIADTVGQGEKFRQTMEGTRAIVQSVGDEALANLDDHTTKLRKDVADLTGDTEKAAGATRAHGAAASEAAPAVQQHADAAGAAAENVKDLSVTLEPVVPLTRAAATESKNFADEIRVAASQVASLKTESGGAVAGLDAVKASMQKLGLTSQQALQQAAIDAAHFFATVEANSDSSAAGLADKQNAFLAYAKAVLAATAQLDEGTRAANQYQLEQKASALGITLALKDLEKQSASSASALTSDAARGAKALNDELNSASRFRDVLADVGSEAGKTEQSVDHFAQTGEEGLADLTQGIANARAGFLGVSQAAAQAYDTILKGAFDVGHSDDGAGFDRVARAMTTALNQVNTEIANDRTQLRGMVSDVENVGQAGAQNFGSFGNDAGAAAQKMRDLAGAIADGTYKVGILGKQDLAQLQSALEAAAQRAQQLADKAASAAQQLADVNDQLQDQIDQANGNQGDSEDRRYQKQLRQLKDLYEQAGKLGSNEYNAAVQRANQLHEINMEKIREEAAAKTKADQGSSSGNSGGGTGGTSGGGTSSGSGGGQTQEQHTVRVTVNRTVHEFDLGSIGAVQTFGNMIDELVRAKGNSI